MSISEGEAFCPKKLEGELTEMSEWEITHFFSFLCFLVHQVVGNPMASIHGNLQEPKTRGKETFFSIH